MELNSYEEEFLNMGMINDKLKKKILFTWIIRKYDYITRVPVEDTILHETTISKEKNNLVGKN